MTNILARRSSLGVSHSLLSNTQLEMDAMTSNFIEGATDWRSLVAMSVGGLAYRVTKLGAMSMGARFLSPVFALMSEVTVYRGTQNLLTSPFSPLPSSSWSTDFINFASLKFFGLAAHNANPILSHAIQDVGMLAGHHLAYGLNLAIRPEGSLFEQLLHAEVMNLQMQAGMALGGLLTGNRLQMWERSLDSHNFIDSAKKSESFQEAPPLLEMSSPREVSDITAATRKIMDLFHRAKTERLEAIEGSLPEEKNNIRRRFLEEERRRLNDFQSEELGGVLTFLESLRPLYLRHIMVSRDAFGGNRDLVTKIVRMQREEGAYDLFVTQNDAGRDVFYFAATGDLPLVQRWARGGELAPKIIQVTNNTGDFKIDEILFLNLHRLSVFQDVVGDEKVERLRAELRRDGTFPHPVQVHFYPKMGQLVLGDGHHHALAALREGYSFIGARFKGRLSPPAAQPIALSEMRRVSMAELKRLQEERDHGQGMTMGSLEELAREEEREVEVRRVVARTLEIVSGLPPFNTAVPRLRTPGDYPGRKGGSSQAAVEALARMKGTSLVYMDNENPHHAFQALYRLLKQSGSIEEGVLALRSGERIIGYQKFNLEKEANVWKLTFMYVWVDEAFRGNSYRDQFQKNILAATLLVLRKRSEALEMTFHQVRNPYNVDRYLAAGLECVEEEVFVEDEDTPYSWGAPSPASFVALSAPPDPAYRIRFPGQMLNGLEIPPHNF